MNKDLNTQECFEIPTMLHKNSVKLALGLLFAVFLISTVSAIDVTGCMNLTVDGGSYIQTKNITFVNGLRSCINVTAPNVVFDGGGYNINRTSGSTGTLVFSDQLNTTIKNCHMQNSSVVGISFVSSVNSSIINCTSTFLDSSVASGGAFFISNSNNTLLENNTIIMQGTSVLGYVGINLANSFNATLRNNNMTGNPSALGGSLPIRIFSSVITGGDISLTSFIHQIDTTNSINNSPIVYNISLSNYVYNLSIEPAMIMCVNCNNITIANYNPQKNTADKRIYLINTTNSFLTNISMSVAYASHQAVSLYGSSNIALNNLTITSFGDSQGYRNAITIIRTDNSTINNIMISNLTSGFSSYGIQLTAIQGISINNVTCSLDTFGGCVGIFAQSVTPTVSSKNIQITNTISVNGGSTFGAFLLGADNITFANNNITNFGVTEAILISGSNLTIKNNYIYNCSTGDTACVYVLYTNYSLFQNNSISLITNGSIEFTRSVLSLDHSNHNLFKDNSISLSDPSINDTSLDGTSINNTFLNVTYNISKESVGSGSQLIRQWYFNTQVNYSHNNNPINGANVSTYNITNGLTNSQLTNSNGNTFMNLTEYVNNAGTRTYYTNYTINITLPNYRTNSTSYNLTGNTLNFYHLSKMKPHLVCKLSLLNLKCTL